MDLHWITPTTSHPPLWCLVHVSLYRTANGGPLSSSFKIQTEVAVVFSSRRFRHHKVQEALPSSRSRCLPSRPRPPPRSASAQGVCLFPRTHTLACGSITGLRRQTHALPLDSHIVSIHHMLPGCSSLCQTQPDQFPSEHNLDRRSDFRAECLLCSWQSMRILTDGFSSTGGEKMP